MTRSLSVIVCAHREERWDQLLRTVASLHAQALPPSEVVVVVDHNRLLFGRLRASLPDVVVVQNRRWPGLAGARNTGLEAARGEVVAFLDDDEVAAVDWLEVLTRRYDDPRVVGVGGSVRAVWERGRPPWFPREFDWVVGCSYRGLPEVAAPVRNLLGGNMSYRREAVAAVGGFTPGVGRTSRHLLGCEETELCIRLRQHRPEWVLVYDPRAVVWTVVPTSRARWSYFRARCWGEGRSKAQVTTLVGRADGLSSERRHIRRVLPQGMAEGLLAARSDLAGLARATAIAAGTAITAAGYLAGRLALRGGNGGPCAGARVVFGRGIGG